MAPCLQIRDRGPVLRDTGYPGTSERFKSDQYRSPCLPQAGLARPAGSHFHLRRFGAASDQYALHRRWNPGRARRNRPQQTVPALCDEVDARAPTMLGMAWLDEQVAQGLADRLRDAGRGSWGQRSIRPSPATCCGTRRRAVRRMGVDLPAVARTSPRRHQADLCSGQRREEHNYVVADVPAMGTSDRRWHSQRRGRRPAQVLAQGLRVFNEFFAKRPRQFHDGRALQSSNDTNSAVIGCRSSCVADTTGLAAGRGCCCGLFGHGGR